MRRTGFGLFWTWLAAAEIAAAGSARLIPPPTPTPASPPADARSDAASADGKALFAKAVEALGGKEKIAKIRDVRTRGQVTARTSGGDMTMDMLTTLVFPDRLSQQLDAPFGRFAMVATPSTAFIVGDQGVQDLPPATRDELLRQVQRTGFYLAQKADDPKFVARAAGEEKIGETQARILDLAYPSVTVRWFIDPATGRILRSSHEATSPEGKPVRVVSNYSDFRTVEGFSLPHRLDVTTDGSPDQTLVLEEIKINAGADPKLFEKPAPAPPSAAPAPTPSSSP
jgi:hypothetical protein